jgi:hypothetical protein
MARERTVTAREALPNRRANESFTFEVDGLRFTATISRFPDGRVGELFLNNHKAGIKATRTPATPRSSCRSRFNTGPTSKPFVRRCVVTATAARSARSAQPSICSAATRESLLKG